MAITKIIPDAKIPLHPKEKSANELKNLRSEVEKVSADENKQLIWRSDRTWRNVRDHASGSNAVAGSSQADPDQLRQLIDKYDIGVDVDLREESHGFIQVPEGQGRKRQPGDQWLCVSYTNSVNWPNPGIKTHKLEKMERKLFEHAMKKGTMSVYRVSKSGVAKVEDVDVQQVETERQAIQQISDQRVAEGKSPVEYYRDPITDEMPPTPKAVDKLVDAHKAAAGKPIYFHCRQGRGTTTTAMVLDDIMNGKSADQAIALEAANGGKDLSKLDTTDATNPIIVKATADRLALIHRFADYWNSPAQKKMTFHHYMKAHVIDAAYENQMMGTLSFVNDYKPAV